MYTTFGKTMTMQIGKKSIKSYAKKNKNKYIFRVLLRHIQHSFTCVALKLTVELSMPGVWIKRGAKYRCQHCIRDRNRQFEEICHSKRRHSLTAAAKIPFQLSIESQEC
jgi:hypothetical protein